MKRQLIGILIGIVGAAFAQDLPYESEAMRKPSMLTGGNVVIKGGRILTVTHGVIEKGDILIRGGKIVEIGSSIKAPNGFKVIDASGKVVTPGIVDAHIHRGIMSTNEGTDSITAEVRIQDVLNPGSKNIWQALAGGETCGMALHGSSNNIGGQSTVIKLKYNRPTEELIVPDAPRMIKFALGENVTRSGSTTSTRFPRTRMGQQEVYRRAFTEARQYIVDWEAWEKSNKTSAPPRRDLRLEALADILKGKIWVQCHSYRADEMLMMVRLSQEFGFKIGAMQHALEAYKIAPELAAAGVGVSMFQDEWSFKIEGYDAIPYNSMICAKAGVNVSINTDGVSGLPSIAIDAGKAMRYGGLTEDQALAMITINPAKELGVEKRVGSLEVGKDGDVVIWSGHPLSVFSRCETTLIEGQPYFERRDAFGLNSSATTKTSLDPNRKTQLLLVQEGMRRYAIVGATIHPVSGPIIAEGTVLLEGDQIKAVGANVSIPRDALTQVINGKGLHVYPGFIDGGSSIGLVEVSPVGQMKDDSELGTWQPDLVAATGLFVQSEHFPVARMGGVLSALTRPNGGTISGQASVINTFGWTTEQFDLGPRILSVNFAGGGGGFDFGHEDACMSDLQYDADGNLLNDFRGGQGRGLGGGGSSESEIAAYFKKATDYAKKRNEDPKARIDLSLEAMIPYVTGKSPVLLRVRTAVQIRQAVAFGEKNNLKVILSGAPDAWKEAKLLAEKQIPVIIEAAGKSTLSANSPASDWDPYDTTFALPALLKKAGVKFCFQSNDGSNAFNLSIKVAQSCAYGLAPEEALRALTLSAAEILGVSDRLGSIDVGKLGNLVISDGDPCETTTNIVGVFVSGKPRALESKFTRLRDQWMKRLSIPQ